MNHRKQKKFENIGLGIVIIFCAILIAQYGGLFTIVGTQTVISSFTVDKPIVELNEVNKVNVTYGYFSTSFSPPVDYGMQGGYAYALFIDGNIVDGLVGISGNSCSSYGIPYSSLSYLTSGTNQYALPNPDQTFTYTLPTNETGYHFIELKRIFTSSFWCSDEYMNNNPSWKSYPFIFGGDTGKTFEQARNNAPWELAGYLQYKVNAPSVTAPPQSNLVAGFFESLQSILASILHFLGLM